MTDKAPQHETLASGLKHSFAELWFEMPTSSKIIVSVGLLTLFTMASGLLTTIDVVAGYKQCTSVERSPSLAQPSILVHR
jgi:hypothetical protein